VPWLGQMLRPNARELGASHAGLVGVATAGGMPMSGPRPRQRMYAYGPPGPPQPSETQQMQTCLFRRDDGDVAELPPRPEYHPRVRLAASPQGTQMPRARVRHASLEAK
jgi:hypothetical protein